MSLTVCLHTDTIGYPEGGGHLWVYLNWALGLRALGEEVIWLEALSARQPLEARRTMIARLKAHLQPYGLDDVLAVYDRDRLTLEPTLAETCLGLTQATEADLLLNFSYGMEAEALGQFRRSALIDIDPGLLQTWLSQEAIKVAPHDKYFTTGETVGRPEANFPDCGLQWLYTPPCVALDHWPVCTAAPEAAFTTVSHWQADEWMSDGEGSYRNDKRSGFLPFLDLPSATSQTLELALCLGKDEDDERDSLERKGWRVVNASAVTNTPWDYQRYIQSSRGEFSCAKPSCVKFQNAWVSDRSLCYLASGKPVVVQHTGPSRVLPDSEGMFRFTTPAEAATALAAVTERYEHHCRQARALAEAQFDAKLVVGRVVDAAMS